MSEDGKRPGGLTALAVLNFVFGGIGALALLALFALIGAVEVHNQGTTNDAEVVKTLSGGLLWLLILLGVVQCGLMIASGVGYLGQKRFLGRTLGNTYAVLSLVGTAIGLGAGQPFSIGSIIGLIYPVLTLVLLNGTFKDDLVH